MALLTANTPIIYLSIRLSRDTCEVVHSLVDGFFHYARLVSLQDNHIVMEDIFYMFWNVADSIVQIGIYLAIVLAGKRIVVVLWSIEANLADLVRIKNHSEN